MSSKTLSIAFLRCLHRLALGEELKASEIASKALLKKFVADGIINERAISKQRRVYVCASSEKLQQYLSTQYDIISLENYLYQSDLEDADGQKSLEASKSTKTLRRGSLQGFFAKAFDVNIKINGENVPVLPNGGEVFVHQPEKLEVSPCTLIVGVENPECFVKFAQLRPLFPDGELLVVMRYMSNSPNRWLENIPNPYLHFGDFDPAGLSIYISEYRNKLGAERCLFFVPDNIEYLIKKYGNTSLYDNQYHLLKNIKAHQDFKMEKLIIYLNKYQKGVEQERLLNYYD